MEFAVIYGNFRLRRVKSFFRFDVGFILIRRPDYKGLKRGLGWREIETSFLMNPRFIGIWCTNWKVFPDEPWIQFDCL